MSYSTILKMPFINFRPVSFQLTERNWHQFCLLDLTLIAGKVIPDFPGGAAVKNLPMQEPWETQVQSLWGTVSRGDPLEKMATHCSIPAVIIPSTEEPGGYSPWGCKDSDMTKHMCTKWSSRCYCQCSRRNLLWKYVSSPWKLNWEPVSSTT